MNRTVGLLMGAFLAYRIAAPVMAAPGYLEAHELYVQLDLEVDKMVLAGVDCNAAGKHAKEVASFHRKMQKKGMTKDGWWMKAKFQNFQEHEIAALDKVMRTKNLTSFKAVETKCPEKSIKDALAEFEKD